MAIPWEGFGLLLAAFVGGLGKSAYNGTLRRIIEDRRSAKDAHAAIPEVQETVERIETKVENVEAGVEATHETIAHLHSDEVRDDPLLRDRLDIDTDHDILSDD